MPKANIFKKSFTKWVYLFFAVIFIISLRINRYIEPFSTPLNWAVFIVFLFALLISAFYSGQNRGILIGFTVYSLIILLILIVTFFVDLDLSPIMLIVLGVYWSYFAPFYPLLDILKLNSFVSFLILIIVIYTVVFSLNRFGKIYFLKK